MKIILKKIIIKVLNMFEKINNDYPTRIKIFYKKNIRLGKGIFNQETIFYGKGKVEVGEKFSIGYRYGGGFKGRLSEIQVREPYSEIKIGDNLAANNGLFICARKRIVIKNDVLIGSQVTIMDHNAHGVHPRERRTSSGTSREIEIGNNVWIGNNVTILAGSKIGDNSIVGVGSVVKGEYPPNVIIQGNPAVVVKKIDL